MSLDKYTKNHIRMMGIELEGAWFKLKPDTKQWFKEDSSVEIEGCEPCACCEGDCSCEYHEDGDNCQNDNCRCYEQHRENHDCETDSPYSWIGELASPTFENYNKMIEWSNDNYPDKCNSSCGAHIHISFNKMIDYSMLMESRFRDYFERKMLEFGEINHLKPDSQFYKRLAGENSFCHKSYTPDLNANNSGDRYQQINACWSSHGTLEIRMLPCFQDKKFTLRAIEYLHTIINEYLNTLPIPKQKRLRRLKLKEKIEVEI